MSGALFLLCPELPEEFENFPDEDDNIAHGDPGVGETLVKIPLPFEPTLTTALFTFNDGNFTKVFVATALLSPEELMLASKVSECMLLIRLRLPAPLLPTPLLIGVVDTAVTLLLILLLPLLSPATLDLLFA